MVLKMTLSQKFAHLPNGIIRESISYTSATYKKRNGKYIGQILKSDIRYVLLLKIPKKKFWIEIHPEDSRNMIYFHSSVILTRIDDDSDRYDLNPSVYLEVVGFKYVNDPIFGNRETIEYKFMISDWKGNVSTEKFAYYHNDEKTDRIIAKITDIENRIAYEKTLLKQMEKSFLLNKKQQCIKNIFITSIGMFVVGLIING